MALCSNIFGIFWFKQSYSLTSRLFRLSNELRWFFRKGEFTSTFFKFYLASYLLSSRVSIIQNTFGNFKFFVKWINTMLRYGFLGKSFYMHYNNDYHTLSIFCVPKTQLNVINLVTWFKLLNNHLNCMAYLNLISWEMKLRGVKWFKTNIDIQTEVHTLVHYWSFVWMTGCMSHVIIYETYFKQNREILWKLIEFRKAILPFSLADQSFHWEKLSNSLIRIKDIPWVH